MITYTTDPSRWDAAQSLLISWPGLFLLIMVAVALYGVWIDEEDEG